MIRHSVIARAILIAAVVSSPAVAAGNSWTIDPAHSSVRFHIKNMMVSNVLGEFKKLKGTVIYDGDNLCYAKVYAVIDAASIDTSQPKRDKHLRSKDFFDVARFDSITFTSDKIVPDQSGAFNVFGTLSMHGISKQAVLHAQPLREIKVAGSDTPRLSATASAQLNRKDFGIDMGLMDHGGMMIADNVQIELKIELTGAQ